MKKEDDLILFADHAFVKSKICGIGPLEETHSFISETLICTVDVYFSGHSVCVTLVCSELEPTDEDIEITRKRAVSLRQELLRLIA